MINLNRIVNNLWGWGKRNAPTIFTALGIAGMGVAVYTVHKTSPKVHQLLEEKKEESRWEKAKTVASVYWPSALIFASSAGLIAWSNKISNRRNVMLATSAAFAQKELLNFQEAAVEKLGTETVKELKDRVAEKKAEETPFPPKQEIVMMGNDNLYLYVEELTGRKFYTNPSKLKEAENRLNAMLFQEGWDYISLNTVWNEIGLSSTTLGDALGFSSEKGRQGMIKFDTTCTGKDSQTGAPYILLTYENAPTGEYPYPFNY